MSDALVRMAARLNAVRVTVSDLVLASQEVRKLPVEDRNWEGRLHLMIRLFSGEPDKGLAIEHRLMAMSSLLASGALPHWAAPQSPDDVIQIAEPVWKAAATEPLLLREKDAYFDKDSFLDRALSFAEPDGHA